LGEQVEVMLFFHDSQKMFVSLDARIAQYFKAMLGLVIIMQCLHSVNLRFREAQRVFRLLPPRIIS